MSTESDARETLAAAEEEVWESAEQALTEVTNDEGERDWSRISDAGAQLLSAGRKGKATAYKLDGDES